MTYRFYFVNTAVSHTSPLLVEIYAIHRYFVFFTYWFPYVISMFHLIQGNLEIVPE